MVGDKDRLANWLEGLASLKELPDLGEDVPV